MSELMLNLLEHIKDKLDQDFSFVISCPLLTVWNESSNKIAVLNLDCSRKYWNSALLNILKDYQADGYIITCEAWVSELKTDDPLTTKIFNRQMEVHELNKEDRSEILLIIGSDKLSKPTVWMAYIDNDNAQRHLIGWQNLKDNSLKSGLVISNW